MAYTLLVRLHLPSVHMEMLSHVFFGVYGPCPEFTGHTFQAVHVWHHLVNMLYCGLFLLLFISSWCEECVILTALICLYFSLSIMRCRFWRQLSKHAGRFSLEISVKVSLITFSKPTGHLLLFAFSVKNYDVFSGIKKYVVGLIIKTSSDPANMEVKWHCCKMLHFINKLCAARYWRHCSVYVQKEGVYISKLNMILVQVNKHVIVWHEHNDWQVVMRLLTQSSSSLDLF